MAIIYDEAGNAILDEAGNAILDEGAPSFPDTPLDVRVELLIDVTWTDVSLYNDHPPVVISRGHPDESVTVSPSTLSLSLTNDGRFSTRNPLGAYYPYLVRNTQCRVSIPADVNYLRLEDASIGWASTADSAGISITGDTEIQLDMRLTDWEPSILAAKWNTSTDKTWALLLNGDGTLSFEYWDGATDRLNSSTVPLPYVSGRFAVKVTLQLNNGSGGHTCTFYTAAAIGGTWTQLGAAVVSSGTISSLFDSTATLSVGESTGYTIIDPHPGYSGMSGRVYEFRLISGIGGTVKADPVFSGQSAGTTSFADAQGNTWTVGGTAEMSDRDYRGHFEVSEWPQKQDQSGKTVTVAAAGGGLLRRLSQRSNPVNSPMYRAWTRAPLNTDLAAYWPMEDGKSASRFASGSGGQAMYFQGAPSLASNSDFTCSGALPVVTGGAVFSGAVSGGTWTDNQVAFLVEIPGGELNGSAICAISTNGPIASLVLNYFTASGGQLTLTGFDATGAQVFVSGTMAFAITGKLALLSVALVRAGSSNVTWRVDMLTPGATAPVGVSTTITSTAPGAVTRVQLNPYGTLGLASTVFGHCAVLTEFTSLFALMAYQNPAGQWTGALNAWAAEPAGVRFARLCGEEGIPFRARGNLTATPLMGVQTTQTIQQLLQECADADRGVWSELRQQLGFGYTTRSALYNQPATVTVDYSQDHLGMWKTDPLEDDKDPVNDVTVTQTSGGSSSRQVAAPGQPITGGRLSTQAPPAGVGTYDQSFSVNLYNDDDLDSEASWILHHGTVDQPRFPGIVLDLTNRALAAQFYGIADLELGDRLVINDPPVQWGPDAVSQLAQQLTETLGGEEFEIDICGVPEQPYEVAAESAAHVDTDGTTLNAGVSSGATSMSFATAAGFPLWSTAGGDYPLDVMIAGERVTVTAMSGSSSPQTATVARSVNGVSKAQSGGAAVNVYPSPVAAL